MRNLTGVSKNTGYNKTQVEFYVGVGLSHSGEITASFSDRHGMRGIALLTDLFLLLYAKQVVSTFLLSLYLPLCLFFSLTRSRSLCSLMSPFTAVSPWQLTGMGILSLCAGCL